MKKTLVALAALSAISAFAQSSVVIDGYFDRGYTSVNNTDNTKDAKSVGSSAGTTTIGIKVREDLGGGLSVGGSVNTDWNDLGGASQGATYANAQRSGFANSQSFLDVTSKQYGTLRLGAPNSFTLTNATAVASPAYSTGIGSSYSSNFSIANGLGTSATDQTGVVSASEAAASKAHAGIRSIRINNTIQYSSPVFLGGLSAHVGYTPKNDNQTTSTKSGNTVGVQEYALRYTQGPIDAMYTSIKYSTGANSVVTYNMFTSNPTQATSTTIGANLTSTQNLLGATYAVLPSLKLHAGIGQFKSSDSTFKGKSSQYGATYTVGAWEISGQLAKVTDEVASNAYDRDLKAMGVNYNFSKTARVYFRTDRINYAKGGNGAAFTSGDAQTRYALGVSKSF